MKVTSVFIKYLNYACKITWIEFLITLCLVKNSIQISKRKHSVTVRLDSFEKPYKQLELVSHRDIQTLENNVWKHSRFTLVFSYIVFSCLDILVKHSLSLFIYYITNLFLAWEPRSHESWANVLSSWFMRARLPGQESSHDVIIENVYCIQIHTDTLSILKLRKIFRFHLNVQKKFSKIYWKI
jgi:hypothetical protein